MKKAVLFIFTCVALSLFQGCFFFDIWEFEVDFTVENDSDDTLSVYLAMGNSRYAPTIYPDTCLPANAYVGYRDGTDSISDWLVPVPPHCTQGVASYFLNTDYWGNGKYRKFFKENHIDTLSVFIINSDTLKYYGYDYVARNNVILARYDLSISDMERLFYCFPYPPSPIMSRMKVYQR